jgi:transaldolase
MGAKGFLSVQVNPKFYPSRDRMVEQGTDLASLAPNIAIKAPATESGIAAIEELSARGVRVNATVSFSVAQAVACAEAIERGLKRAPRVCKILPYVTIMTGRVDDHLKRVEGAKKTGIDPRALDWAGIAVFRRTARIFRERGYAATLLSAAYRHEGHWAEIIGPGVLQTIPYKWWKQFDLSAREVALTLDRPVDEAIVSELAANFPEFRAAYEERGMKPPQFVHYGASTNTLGQFLAGYQQLVELVRARMLI